jgi:hypothetical protein
MNSVASTYVEETAFGFCFWPGNAWQRRVLRAESPINEKAQAKALS